MIYNLLFALALGTYETEIRNASKTLQNKNTYCLEQYGLFETIEMSRYSFRDNMMNL